MEEDKTVIAYVFWHQKQPAIRRSDYEHALAAFYEALAESRPEGLRRIAVFRTSRVPWLPAEDHAFEEWYVLDDSAALDALNDSAVSGACLQPHNRVAAMSAAGVAGVYSFRLGDESSPLPLRAHWFSKPDGMPYRTFFDSLSPLVKPGVALWGRRMVLGPTPEFCLHSPGPVELPYAAHPVSLDPLFAQDLP